MKSSRQSLVIFSLVILSYTFSVQCQTHKTQQSTTVGYVEFKPNNNAIWFSNNGDVALNPATAAAGWEWKRGSGKFVGFETGVLWGGFVSGMLRVGGSAYRHALQPGNLDSTGNASDPKDPRFRVYYIKKEDATTGTNPDYNEWPRKDGAPVDVNGKPYFYGDEQLWFVSNDLDPAITTYLYGTAPIGLEVQTTVWAFNKNPLLEDVVFVKHLLINKSSSDLEQAYISLWSDFDLGDGHDDFVGVDTTLQLSYCYNGLRSDPIYGTPPAAGLIFLQTPIVASPIDTVVFKGVKKAGYKYAPLNSYVFFINGSPIYRDPTQGVASGAIEMYNNFRGNMWNGNPFIDPTTGLPTRFCLSGDPLVNKGWIDGIVANPGERRSMIAAGPFNIAKADTQEVVYAMLAQQGSDRIESLSMLKDYAAMLQFFYRTQQKYIGFPKLDIAASYPNVNQVTIKLNAIDSNAIDCKAVLLSANKTTVAEIQLLDDGNHNDGLAGDHHFGAQWSSQVQREGVDIYFDITYPDGTKLRWFGKKSVPLCGNIRLTTAYIESDHLNQDRKANPGENVRITLDVKNETPFTLDEILCTELDGMTPTKEVYRVPSPFPAGATVRRNYSDTASGRFVAVDIPLSAKGGEKFLVHFLIQDSYNNDWYDSVYLDVYDFSFTPIDSLAIHIAGNGTGALGFRIVDPSQWKYHMYKISVSDKKPWDRFITVYDVAEKRVRASNIQMPDIYGHDFPTIDGMRITQGTSVKAEQDEYDSTRIVVPPIEHEYIPPQNDWLVPNSGFDWIAGENFFGSSLTAIDLIPVRLIFSKTEIQKGYMYLRGGTPNYGYKSFGTVPFRVYDMSDSLKPRQINVAFVEMNGNQFNDNQWMPGNAYGDREYLFILKSTYSDTPDTFYTARRFISDASIMDILYAGWFIKKTPTSIFQEGDEIRITPTIPISPRDTFIVNIKGKTTNLQNEISAGTISLSQNYPNPFTGTTAIGYRLSAFGRVKLEVFDLLGRKVAMLVDEEQDAGVKQVEVNVKEKKLNDGIYFYQLEANGITIRKKMIVLQ